MLVFKVFVLIQFLTTCGLSSRGHNTLFVPSPSDFIKIGEGNKIAGGKSKKEREIKLENSSLILYDVTLGNPRHSRVSQTIPEYPRIS